MFFSSTNAISKQEVFLSAELRRQAWASVGVPIFALVSIVLVMALGLLTYFAQAQDREFEANSRQLVANEIDGHVNSVRDLALDWGNWQAAYDGITRRWDGAWVKETYFTDLVDHVRIVRDNQMRYVWLAAGTNPDSDPINAVLAAEYARSAVPTATTHIFRSGNTLMIMSSHPVTPEQSSGPIRDKLVLIRALDRAELTALGAALGLTNFRIRTNREETSHEPVVSLDIGSVTLLWDHESPGSVGFSKLALLVVSWVSLVGTLAWFVARRQVHKQIALASSQQASLEASRLKSQFLFTMSHELRTPLNSIIGYSEILEEDLETAPTIASPDDARRIRSAADHLLTLINEVLDLSAIESGKFKLNPSPVDIRTILQEVADTVRPAAAKLGTSVRICVGEDIPTLSIDGLRLKQCVLNLASNACKFTQDGEVHISASMKAVEGDPTLVVVVADTGIGITQEDQARLFQPFSQLDDGATRAQDGTGLGLVITQKIARAMGGEVSVQSSPGLGATFTLSISAGAKETSLHMDAAA